MPVGFHKIAAGAETMPACFHSASSIRKRIENERKATRKFVTSATSSIVTISKSPVQTTRH